MEGPETVRLLDKRQAKAWKLPLHMNEALQQVGLLLVKPCAPGQYCCLESGMCMNKVLQQVG